MKKETIILLTMLPLTLRLFNQFVMIHHMIVHHRLLAICWSIWWKCYRKKLYWINFL